MLSAAGDIAFVGFNSDGNDNLAFVTFVDIPAGQVVHFSDNEWNGTGWQDFNETGWSWTASAAVLAGSVVTIDNIGSGSATSNLGTVAIPLAGMGSNRGLAAGAETIYAYLATSPATPTTFLTALTNNNNGTVASGLLTNTGLVYGVNAIDLSAIDVDADIGAYAGPRSGEASIAAYRAMVNTASNWITQDGSGDQGIDAIAPDVPFSTAAFMAGSALPTLSIDSVSIAEGNAGTTAFSFTVSLSAASEQVVTVNYASADGTASALTDYAAVSGTLTFEPGETVKTVTVSVNGDTATEASEAFTITLASPANVAIVGGTGVGTIQNDDVSITRIHDIQGSGLVSAFAGQTVTTTGSLPQSIPTASISRSRMP